MKTFIIFIIFLTYCIPASASELSDYQKIKCIIHIHTDISTGTRSLESYINESKAKGIKAIVLTDTDWNRWEYGLPPFRRILKKVVQKKSVMTFGIKRYLNLIDEMNKKYRDIVIIDGIQTNPFYYWSGNFLEGTLALNNRNKDMLVIGLNNANNYKNMPLMTNRRSKFDAYHGDKFTQPYQDLIDYVIKKDGLIFWSHPEYEENTVKDGITLITVPYCWDLVGTYDYTGFGIFWSGYEKTGKAKGIWDRILTEYCQGRRKTPVWAIGELEEEGVGNVLIDHVVNVLCVKTLNQKQVLSALKKGKFYVTFNIAHRIPLVLEEFTVSDETDTKAATMGEELSSPANPIIKFHISYEQPMGQAITVKLIRNNEIIKEFIDKSQIKIRYKDEGLTKKQLYYYRIDVTDQSGNQLISNPIFFKKDD